MVSAGTFLNNQQSKIINQQWDFHL